MPSIQIPQAQPIISASTTQVRGTNKTNISDFFGMAN